MRKAATSKLRTKPNFLKKLIYFCSWSYVRCWIFTTNWCVHDDASSRSIRNYATHEEVVAQLLWSCCCSSSFSEVFSTGKDSPVSAASLTCRSLASTILMSAATISPTYRETRSPGTSNVESVFEGFPSLTTTALIDTFFRRASTAFSALYSLKKSNATARTIIANIDIDCSGASKKKATALHATLVFFVDLLVLGWLSGLLVECQDEDGNYGDKGEVENFEDVLYYHWRSARQLMPLSLRATWILQEDFASIVYILVYG